MNGRAELKRDREAVLQAVRQHGHPLQFAAEELRGNHEVVLESVRQDGYALQLSSEDLRGDRESFLDRVREKGFVLRNTSDDLKRDREIVLVHGDAAARSRNMHVDVDDQGRQRPPYGQRAVQGARLLSGARTPGSTSKRASGRIPRTGLRGTTCRSVDWSAV